MCDWEGCTTGTIGLPNPNRRSVVKTSGFLHPYIYRYTARVPRDRFLVLEGEGDNLDGTAIVPGNRAIFSAHRILAKHRGVSSTNRRVRIYKLTAAGTKHLEREVSSFERMLEGITHVLAPGES
jgi:hypothetical protein